MQNSYRFLALLLLAATWGTAARAQDPAFSQYYNTPFLTNPAMLSFRPDMVVGANFRSQWAGLGQAYTTTMVSGFYPILSKNKLRQFGAAGGFVMSDRQPVGSINTTSFGLAGAYKLPLNYANFVHFGIQLGYFQRSLSLDGATTGSQAQNNYYNPSLPLNEGTLDQSRGAGTIALGASWVNEDVDGDIRAQAGISAFHMNAPNISFTPGFSDNIYRNIIATATVRAVKAPGFSLYPGARYIWQGNAHKLNVGGLARFGISPGGRGPNAGKKDAMFGAGTIGFGLFYQAVDASAAIATVELVQPRYAVSVNYDLGVGQLKDGSTRGNATEFFVCYRKTLGKRRKVDLRYFKTNKNGEPAEGANPGGTAPDPAPAPTPPEPQAAPTTEPAPAQAAPAPADKPAASAAAPAPAPQPKVSPAPTTAKAQAAKVTTAKGKKNTKAAKAKAKAKRKAVKRSGRRRDIRMGR